MTDPSPTPDSAPNYVVVTPGPTSGDWGNLLRLGGIAADEQQLQQDPATTTALPPMIGSDAAAAFNAGTLSYTLGTAQVVAPGAYFRLGAPAGYESWLQSDPDAAPVTAAPPATATASPYATGALLHSTQAVSLFAPAINQNAKSINTQADSVTNWSGSSLGAVFDGNGLVSTVTRTQADLSGVLSTTSMQIADNYSTLVGNTVGTIVGSSATVWTGNDASTGVGSLLWSNFGTTQNIFGGQIVNITNDSVEVQGFGSYRTGDMTNMAPEMIQLGVSPLALAATTVTSRFMTAVQVVNAAAAAAMAVLTVGATATVAVGALTSKAQTADRDKANASLDGYMTDYQQQIRAVAGLVFAVQVLGIVAGNVARVAAVASAVAPTAGIEIGDAFIKLSVGANTVIVDPTGLVVDAATIELLAGMTTASLLPTGWNVV